MMQIRPITVDEARTLRMEVLRPGLPPSASVYACDDETDTFHLGAFAGESLLCVATFSRDVAHGCDWRLRGMATRAQMRNQGVGGRVLDAGIARVREQGGAGVWCNGRSSARRFYERHGFVAIGDEFDLPHSGAHFVFVNTFE
jgi:GNAT superfamily N-acetyltransferase